MTKEEKRRIIYFCKSYIPARKELMQAKKDKTMLEKKLGTELTTFERLLIEDTLQKIERKIEKQLKIMYQFEIAVNGLNSLDRCILRQLYIEGKAWSEVVNREGIPICTARVGVIRNRALEKLANYLSSDEELRGVESGVESQTEKKCDIIIMRQARG